jgi:restriction endonuclease S subunit
MNRPVKKAKIIEVSHQLRKQSSRLLTELPAPSDIEQLKIIRAIDSIDDAIEELDRLLQHMEEEKKLNRMLKKAEIFHNQKN